MRVRCDRGGNPRQKNIKRARLKMSFTAPVGDAPQVVHRSNLTEHIPQALFRRIVRHVSDEHAVGWAASTHLGA